MLEVVQTAGWRRGRGGIGSSLSHGDEAVGGRNPPAVCRRVEGGYERKCERSDKRGGGMGGGLVDGESAKESGGCGVV